MDLLDLIQQKRFLGAEFLTWIWFQSERGGGVVDIPDKEAVTLWIDDKIELSSLDPSDQKSVLRGGSPSTSPEARASLKEERKASAVKLRLAKGDREWSFALDAANLDLKSVKIPALLTSEEDDKFFERVHLMEELKEVVELLFKRFIETRTGVEWADERKALAQWVASEGKNVQASD
jgi:recombination associated protein RdgC